MRERENKMNEVRIIKRYQNRKLYDTHQSCYVTLEEIAQIVREGNEIKVIDNKSKNDITYMTQIQLLFDQERKSTKTGDVELLKRAIRSTEGTFTSYLRELESKLNENKETEGTEAFNTFLPANEAGDTTQPSETTNVLN